MAIYKNKRYHSLFLDRDGVINYEKLGDYIYNRNEFKFYPGSFEAFRIFNALFQHIIVVTNQRGIGRGLIKAEAVEDIHRFMQHQIEAHDGRIDAIYYCPDAETVSNNRKPNTGMGLQALSDFEDINFSKSIMVGNTNSDMMFGRNLGMQTIFIRSTRPDVDEDAPSIDAVYDSLYDFAVELKPDKF